MTAQFWTNNPTILLNKNYIFDLWPTSNMKFEEKLNAITRLVILLSLLGFVATMSLRMLIIGFITLLSIFILYKMQKPKISAKMLAEGFNNQNTISTIYSSPVPLESALKTDFKMGNIKNPFSNVLLTDIADDPQRKPAPPSFNPDIDEDIVRTTKKMVQELNPGIKNAQKQLFGDLYNNFEFDQSNRVFYSNANTKVANDQGAFGKFLYGYMPSGKESNADGALARVQDNYRYTLY